MIKTGARKILFVPISIMLLIMAIVYYSFSTGRDIAVRYSPLVDAVTQIKLESASAHLWLEEAIGGDKTINIDEIWAHFDKAEWYARAILDGNKNDNGNFVALNDSSLRIQMKEIIGNIETLRKIAIQRWNSQLISGVGTQFDQQFDQTFLTLNLAATGVESALQNIMIERLQTFKRMEQILMSLILILGIVTGWLLLRYNTRINKYILALHKQKESLHITLNSIGDAVLVTDTDGVVTYINPVAIQLTGWTSERAVGQPLADVFNIVHAVTKEPISNPIKKVLDTGLIVGLANNSMLISKDGSEYQIADSGAPIRNLAGDISGVVLIFRDVTKDSELNRALESSQILIKTLLDTLPDLICLKDKEGVYLACNSKFERMIGFQESEIVGKTDYDFTEKRLADFYRDNDNKVLMAGESIVIDESATYADDGHYELIETIKTPMVDKNEHLIGVLSVSRDVTKYKASLAQLQESESKLMSAQVYAKIGYWELLVDQKTAIWSEQMYALFGLLPNSTPGPETLCKVMNEGDFPDFTASVQECFEKGCEHHVTYRITRPNDGEERWVECRGKVILDNEGKPQKISGFIQDITEWKNAQGKLQLSSRVFSNTHEGIIITDAQQVIVDINPAFSQITGFDRVDVIGKHSDIMSSDKHHLQFYAEMWKIVKTNGYWQGELWNKTKQGEAYAELLTISSLKDEHDQVTHYIGMFSDITASKWQQDQLTMMAQYDVLTKLPNRALFVERFHQSIEHSVRTGDQLAVCFLDLDDFKPVNDNYGHDVGDRLLIEVADRLSACIREEDTVSRQGGDEFALLLNDIKLSSQYEATMNRIHQALAQPYLINDVKHYITASSGITLYPLDDSDIDTLLRHADHAMYQSKLLGKHRCQLYSPDSDKKIINKNHRLDEIEVALINNEFQLYYQPKVNMVTGNVFGMEALIRWIHPEKGLIPPLDFLPYVDGTSLEVKIGEWVINKALQQLDEWQQQGIKLEVSVNISSNHLLSSSFVVSLKNCLAKYSPNNAQYLQLEILESSAFGDIKKINHIIKTCQNQLGVSFALDDFGTGYSSLTHLRGLPVNTIKIDQSFVRDMLEDPSDYAIIDGVIALTKSFNRNVIAEGVETIEQGLMLLLMGSEEAQGYAIAKPMPGTEVSQWLSAYEPNNKWLYCGNKHRNNKENSLDIFRMINLQWIEKFRESLASPLDKQKPWPILDSQLCQCGNWIRREKQEQLFDKESIRRLEQAHNKTHAIANTIECKYQEGAIESARLNLAKLELAVDEMSHAVGLCE